jgi:hypothetical protein
MKKICVDTNAREGYDTIVIFPQDLPPEGLSVGERVIIHEPGVECEAIVRRGAYSEWVADIVEGTIRDTSLDQ